MRDSVDTALILAGGSSTRFRAPKALVDVAGKPMVQRVFEAVSPFAGEVIVSIADRLNYVPVGPDRIRRVDPDLSSFVDVNSRVDLDEVLRRVRASEAPRDTH